MHPEQKARKTIDHLLSDAGWEACDPDQVDLFAHRGVAIREFPLRKGHSFAEYLLYVDGRAAGGIEAKREGTTLSGKDACIGH